MPSLIGSAPNQVPTNGMLGTMAFQDADNALVQNITVTGSSSVPTKAVTDNSTASASTAFVKGLVAANNEILTTTGTGAVYVITPTVPITSYTQGQEFTVKFHAISEASSSINVSGLGTKPLGMRSTNGSIIAVASNDIVTNTLTKIRYDGTYFVLLESQPATTAQAVSGTNSVNVLTPSLLRSGLNASGSAPIYACRAWVNFNGTGTVAIRASGNVTSITDNGVGDYTVNFTTAMEDANYGVYVTAHVSGVPTTRNYDFVSGLPNNASSMKIFVTAPAGSAVDAVVISACVFR